MTIKITGLKPGESLSGTIAAGNGSRGFAVSNWRLKPSTIGSLDWDIDEVLQDGAANILVSNPPTNITSYQARIDGGTPFTFTPGEVENAGFVSGTAVSVEIRGIRTAGSLVVEGDWSDAKLFTADDGLIGPLGDNQWTIADTGAGGSAQLDFLLEPSAVDARAVAFGYTIDSTSEAAIVALANGAVQAIITGLTNDAAVAVRVWVRNDDGIWGPVSAAKNATPTLVAVATPGTYGTGDWSLSNGGSGTNAIISVTAHPSAADTVQYDLGASGTWITLGGLAASYTITGLTEGASNSIRLRAVNVEAVAGAASTAKTITPTAVTEGVMTAGSWAVVNEPSPLGDSAAITVSAMPAVTDREVIGYDIEINGTTIQQLPLGHYPTQVNADLTETPLKHMAIVPAEAEASLRIRPILRQISPPISGPERLVERGAWSEDTKTVTPTVGTMSLVIQTNATTARRDEAVFFRAVLTGSGAKNQFADPHFEWDFGEDSGDFTSLASDFPGNKNSRVQLMGWTAAHSFKTLGVKTVTCTARYRGAVVEDAVDITVSAWANNIVYISNTDPSADFTTMLAAMNSLPPSVERQYLLKRGDVFVDDRLSSGASLTNTAPMLIGAYGSGAKPIMRNVTRVPFSINVGASVLLKDIRIEGSYVFDPIGDNALFPGSPQRGVSISSFNGARFTGVGLEASALNESFSGGGYDIVFSDCKIDDWYNFAFGIFQESGNFALVGCTARQNPLAQSAKRKPYGPKYGWNVPWTPLHGSHRQSRILGPTCLYACDLASFNSWASDTGHQPTLRWGSGGAYETNLMEGCFGNLRLEGGQLGNGAGTSGAKVYSAGKLMDGIWWLSTTSSRAQLGHGGETWRNVIAYFPDVPVEGGGNGASSMVNFGGQTKTFLEEDVYLDNCTFVDLRSSENTSNTFALASSNDRRFHRLQTSNLVLHAPNGISGGTTADAPLDMTSSWTPRYEGRRNPAEFSGALQPEFGNSPSDTPAVRPLTGSAAIADATGDRIPYRDFYGTVRGANPSRGAIEPE